MKEFNVGDIVRVRKDLVEGRTYKGTYFAVGMGQYAGKTFKIVNKYFGTGKMRYNLENCGSWNFIEEMLEPVEITLNDLQFADVLTIRNGERYVYVDRYMYGESDDYSCDCCKLEENYNNDLTSEDGDEDCDIVKVERKGEVIFERVEETKREMTIEEIEKELGYSIKIVKEVA